jgi:hypothetical protein
MNPGEAIRQFYIGGCAVQDGSGLSVDLREEKDYGLRCSQN